MKKILFLLLVSSTLFTAEELNKQKLIQAVEKISQQQTQLLIELDALKVLLGVHDPIKGLDLMQPKESMEGTLFKKIKEGINRYREADYEEAKVAFQKAWEQEPNLTITNFNLALAYHRLGNLPLAKKMLKNTLEINQDFSYAERINDYLDGVHVAKKEKEETSEEKIADTELTNLTKEVVSYVQSTNLNYAKRMQGTLNLLDKIVKKASSHEKLIAKHYLEVADRYAVFEYYTKARRVLEEYQTAMKGKVLPDVFHGQLLKIKESEKTQKKHLAKYLEKIREKSIQKRLDRDLYELDIFATQLEEFVSEPTSTDSDFAKICQRLGEYRWGNRPNRHVIVTNPYQELLYSSLPGTLALDRYEDTEGRKFFQDLCLLTGQLAEKTIRASKIHLKLHGKQVPYLLLYAYVPSKQALIVVRIPEQDLKASG